MASPAAYLCFICEESLTEHEVIVVKKRGIATLITSSIKRNKPQNRQLLEGLEEITVHTACQKKYNNEKLILVSIRREQDTPATVPKPTRSGRPSFDFNNRCFLCEKEVTEEYRQKQARLNVERRNPIVKVTLPDVANTILINAKERGDEWGRKIEERLTMLDSFKTDLVAVNAEYHHKCIKHFYKMPARVQKRPGRSTNPNYDQGMKIIYKYLDENSDECQFSIGQLLDQVPKDSRPHVKTLKRRLEEKYKGDIIISDSANRASVVSFTNIGHQILSDSWYSNEKKGDPHAERSRIVKTAGKIILEDIRSKIFNTAVYPPIDNFFAGSRNFVPETLLLLLHTIILTNKRGSLDSWQKRCLALAHAIMLAVRPKSFLSPIMIGVATYVYKKFGSKLLLNLLTTLGFSASYEEAARLEGSYVLQAKKAIIVESASPFSQFIFDNADFNVNTLDGRDTFHAMGGIMAVTPQNAVTSATEVMRMKVTSASDLIGKAGTAQVKQYTRPPNGGLKSVRLFDIDISPVQDIVPSACDIAWIYGKSTYSSTAPGWNGFMELKTQGEKYECSKIVCLPFINAPPSDYSTIYTSILTALEECKLLHQKTCITTFDQPLFWKARDVVASVPEFLNVDVRLGGFHLLMSFMGAIGTIMAGSGLKQLFSEIFAGNSVDKILSGHAYSRAVRAHSLAYAAFGGLIIEVMVLKEEDLVALNTVINSSTQSSIGSEDPALQAVAAKFAQVLKTIADRGPTAALWIQYFRMCTLMKNFIRAERAGDWDLHLDSVREMIPYFHAAGHLNYAKSAHLYYQDMVNLKDKMDPEEYDKFTTKGYFTIRRTDKFWSGIWSDMTIEQVLMRSMKSYGGLTRGRGVSNSVLSRWIVGMICLQSINEQMELFTGVRAETTEQHVDMRTSRVARDNLDIKKLTDWLADHPPFLNTQDLLSIGTGAVVPDGVNCYVARSVGITSMKTCLKHGNFQDLKLKRKDKVVTLASFTCSLKIKNKNFTVDPLTLFQRICITKHSDADLRNLFKYELAPYPMSLFTEEGMHKGRKSMLYDAFRPIQEEVDVGNSKCAVIDGGYLLHKVVWGKSKDATFDLVCTAYVDYVQRHFGTNAIVVFDGYPVDLNYQSTKAAERYRRSRLHSATKFVFSKTTPCDIISQAKFLANDTNKKNFIALLMSEMEAKGIQTKQATEDADVLIVKTAISQAEDFDSVIITGEDIDLLVLLTALGSFKKKIYFQKSGRGNIPSVLYSSHSCKFNTQDILFLHGISGCDTTSAPFGIGKKKVMQVYDNNPYLSDVVSIFKDPHATPHQISEAGEKFLVKLYGGTVDVDNLDDLRYHTFSTVVARPKFQLARLPPTRDAAKYHCYRTYLQVQTWLENEGTQRKVPSAWGWSFTKQGVIPTTTTMDAAPGHLLKIIRCKCTTGCSTGTCSCRKAGLRCSVMCKHCTGSACENSPEADFNAEDTDEECKEQATLLGEISAQEEENKDDDSDDNLPLAPKRSRRTEYF